MKILFQHSPLWERNIWLKALLYCLIFASTGVVQSVYADSATLNFSGRFNQAGCTVSSSSSLTVSMGDWYSNDFTGVGSTTTNKSVPVVLNCAAGAKVVATLQANSSDPQNGKINVTSSGGTTAATGVNVQLVNASNTPLVLNSSFIVTNYASGGSYPLNWYAHYIQTSTPITAGSAYAVAVLTLSYQ